MKYIGIILLAISLGVSAQEAKFPPQCNARLLTPTNEALCGDLFEIASTAEKRYTKALASISSMEQWDRLQIIKMQLLSRYYSCSITGSGPAVSSCLQPALQEVIESLPLAEHDTTTDTLARARKVNISIETIAHNLLKQCVNKRAEMIDDGLSTAHDIAQGIGEWCRPAATKLADVRFATLTTSLITSSPTFSQTRALADDILRPSNLIEAILEYRAQKRIESKKSKQKRAKTT